jgi:hypothetical protein
MPCWSVQSQLKFGRNMSPTCWGLKGNLNKKLLVKRHQVMPRWRITSSGMVRRVALVRKSHTAYHSRWWHSSKSPPWKPQILHSHTGLLVILLLLRSKQYTLPISWLISEVLPGTVFRNGESYCNITTNAVFWDAAANLFPSSPILFTLLMEAKRSSETYVLTTATRC